MLEQVSLLWKHFSTLTAAEGGRRGGDCRDPSRSGTSQAAVLNHLDLLDETLATRVAPEGTFTRVNTQVVTQVGHDVGRVATQFALKLLGRAIMRMGA